MIEIHKRGHYKLIETRHHIKVLYLGTHTYAWVQPSNMGQILVSSHRQHKTDCVLSVGQYFIYDVDDEPNLSDQIHLELEVGKNQWQGYLLLTGLPNSTKKRGRIIPTQEVITDSLALSNCMPSRA